MGAPNDTIAWPEPRLRALQVEELYRHAPIAAAYSLFGAALVLGVLIEIGRSQAGTAWFLFATVVTFIRAIVILNYRRRAAGSNPDDWAKLARLGNALAGLQWGVLGTILFPAGPVYAQLFALMVIICFVAGSVTTYAAVPWAHEALSIPAAVPTAGYLFVVRDGPHWYAGIAAMFFCFAIVYYARQLTRHLERGLRLQLERDDLIAASGAVNEKLGRENADLAHLAAVRGASVEGARETAGRMRTFFEGSPFAQLQCDARGHVTNANPAAERLFGQRDAELRGAALDTLVHPTRDLRTFATFASLTESIEVEVRDRYGIPMLCMANFTTLGHARDGREGLGVVLTGIRVPVA